MDYQDKTLKAEDYQEPRCAVCSGDPSVPRGSVPMQRVTDKLDEYFAKRDMKGAERHLLYWLSEARMLGDTRGEMSLRSELAGLYRKLPDEEKAVESAERAIELADMPQAAGTLSAATVYVNAATAFQAFGRHDRAIPVFEKAKAIYEASEDLAGAKLGSLYNNMALALAGCGRYDEAEAYFMKAIDTMGRFENGQIEQAISWLNVADLYEAKLGAEDADGKVCECLDRAQELLDSPKIARNVHYAYAANACADTFSYYGYFAYAKELRARSEEIYDRA